jgi:hypothetical protein
MIRLLTQLVFVTVGVLAIAAVLGVAGCIDAFCLCRSRKDKAT